MPDINDDNCYFEIEDNELLKARFYPSCKRLEIRSTYRQKHSLGASLFITEYYSSIVEFDYFNKTIDFTGEYERTNPYNES